MMILLPKKALPVITGLTLLCAGAAPVLADNPTGPRTFHVQPDKSDPSVPEIDNAVLAVMKANGVYGASLAIVQDTRLVYAKGYTWAPAQYPTTQPTTLFRQASVSKLFASLATYQLIQEGKLSLDTPIQSVLQAKWFNGRPPSPTWNKITVQNLLEMDGGLDSSLPWIDPTIAEAAGKPLPVTPAQIANYATMMPLISAPGDKAQAFYNNSDYLLLGQVVAKKRGAATFIDAIQGSLLSPLHITRIHESRSLESQQRSDEARYHPSPFATRTSVMTPDRPTVTQGYGDAHMENMGGAGGLSGAATDVARVLAALSLRDKNPMLTDASIQDMLGRAAADYVNPAFSHKDSDGNSDAFGFYGLDYAKAEDKSKGIYRGYKGGYLSTSQNGIYFERGGLSYVINWNGHTPNGEGWYPAFKSVLAAAGKQDWGTTDLFPKYGMPSLTPSPRSVIAAPNLSLQPLPTRKLEILEKGRLLIPIPKPAPGDPQTLPQLKIRRL